MDGKFMPRKAKLYKFYNKDVIVTFLSFQRHFATI